MPELPEVETVACNLAAQILRQQIVAITKFDWERMLEMPDPATFRMLLPGRQIIAVGRRAKWLLLTLDAGWTLALHLRMSGRISVHTAEAVPDTYTHLVLKLDDGRQLFFHDPRKFGRVRLLDAQELAHLSQNLGPEPLSDTFTVADLTHLLARRTALKPLLLNQSVIAGLGNIYVDESLWHAHLHPLRRASSLTPEEIAALYTAIRSVLMQAITNGGSTLRDYRNGYGQMGENQEHFSVYDRKGHMCSRCQTSIVRMVVAQRGTYLCPRCQTLGTETRNQDLGQEHQA